MTGGDGDRERRPAASPPQAGAVAVDLSAAVLAVDEADIPAPLVRIVGGGTPALPAGPFTPARHRTLEDALLDGVAAQAGLRLGHVEQLYGFADRYRDPAELSGQPRRLSIGYLALARPQRVRGPEWHEIYGFLPWEDWRAGPPPALGALIRPALAAWAARGAEPTVQAARRRRIAATFGRDGRDWNPVPVLERYELLYECELAAEARRDAWARAARAAETLGAALPDALAAPAPALGGLGEPMLHDHRRILATALGRLRARIAYRPAVAPLLPPSFTLTRMQAVVEALVGMRLHKQNFRRLLGGLVEPAGGAARTAGRPAALFRFRRELSQDGPAAGIGLPIVRGTGASAP